MRCASVASDARALEVLAAALAELGVRSWPITRSARVVREDRDACLRRLATARRRDAAIRAYRHAIDDLLTWTDRHGRDAERFKECTIVDYLELPHSLPPRPRDLPPALPARAVLPALGGSP